MKQFYSTDFLRFREKELAADRNSSKILVSDSIRSLLVSRMKISSCKCRRNEVRTPPWTFGFCTIDVASLLLHRDP